MLLLHLFFPLLAGLLVAAYTPPPGSPGFYHGNSTAAVTFDAHSMFIDNKRVFIFSGEFHPWRSPSGKPLWRDIFQKMKAAGFNAASLYFHWGLTEQKQGELNFDYYRSQADAYEVAKEVGMLIISRPGPYINAETTAGGFPGWLTNVPAKARTNQTGYTDAWMPYAKAVAKFLEPYQYPDGPVIALQCENEFQESSPGNPGRSEYMALLEDTYRSNGITKIPLTHNDPGRNGVFASGLGRVDIYEWDEYPNGFNCSNPSSWSQVDSTLDADHHVFDPDVVWVTAEFQGGSFDPWAGAGYDQCFQLINEQFANVFYKNNYAAQVASMNLYMTFGGTNWGNLAEPSVYTSYDYGAPIREDRTLSPKYSEIKLQSLFLHASPSFLVATRFGNGTVGSGTAFSNNTAIYTTALSVSGTGAINSQAGGGNFYVVRHTDNSIITPTSFSLRVNTSEGEITIPQFGGNITLDGRESKIILTEYPFGSTGKKLTYSTAEVMTWSTIDGVDYLILYALADQTIEAVVSGASNATPTVSGSSGIKARSSDGNVIITGTPSDVSVVSFSTTRIIVLDKLTALTFWSPRLLGTGSTQYDVSTDVPSVIVAGPYLLRNASISGSTLALQGDLNSTVTLDVIAPSSVSKVTWNNEEVNVKKSNIGTLRGTLSFGLKTPSLPSLKSTTWSCADSLPEIQDGFDDSSWITANKTNTSRPLQPLAGKFVLYTDEYGFHQGNTITRGHFSGTNATGVQLSVQGGQYFGYSAFINSKFLGSDTGENAVDLKTDTWTFNSSDLNDGDNVVTVVVDPTGLEEDGSGNDLFKNPRGVRGYELLGGGDFDFWKVQGNLGGESGPDTVRGPMNEGGLFVEREGAHLPGFPATNWTTSKEDESCTPFSGLTTAGIKAYRTTFDLNLAVDTDVPIALQFERTPTSSYRTVMFINGWQFGKFNSIDGPQTIFPLPEGVLNHRGTNELLITIWSLDAEGAKIANVELINTANVQSSKEAVPLVPSPSYQQLRG